MGGVGEAWREWSCPPSFPWRPPISSPAHTPECRRHPRETQEGPCVQGPGPEWGAGTVTLLNGPPWPWEPVHPRPHRCSQGRTRHHPWGPRASTHRTAQGLPSPGRSTWTLSPRGLWMIPTSTVGILLSLELLPGQPGDCLAWWLLGQGGPWKVTWLLPVLPSRKYGREGLSLGPAPSGLPACWVRTLTTHLPPAWTSAGR